MTLHVGHCLDALRTMPRNSIDCCVTSPPYYGLRKYEGVDPVVWGGDAGCAHEWGDSFCQACGAWRGCLGLEPTYPLYLEHMVAITVQSKPYRKDHFATFPPALIKPCILAGCPEGGIVLDPFIGSGTTALVAQREGRQWIGIEASEQYAELARERVQQKQLF